MSIDAVDMKVVKCLIENSRTTYRAIAEEVGVSEATVKNRIDGLVEEGVITNFTAVLDYHKLGRAIKSFIGLKVQPAKLQDIVDEMKGHPDVHVLYRTSGDVDLFLEVIFEKMEDLNAFLEKELVFDGILGTVVTIVIGPYKRCPWTGL
jgi:Lrp/AsnC family leucine-responsive transcriptional regulator